MSQFEVKRRDGLARRGRFTHEDETYELPLALDLDSIFPALQRMSLSNIPLSAGQEFVRRYHSPGVGEPIAVHPLSEEEVASGSCVMVSNWHTALQNPRSYVQWLVMLKSRMPCDTAWYAPATALPSNAHLLVYSGFDLFDHRAVDLATSQGLFCTAEGEFPDEWMDAGSCLCPGCQKRDLRLHNRTALARELAVISRFVDRSQLRELVEARSRLHPEQVAIFRHLDACTEFIEPYVPVVRTAPFLATSGDSLHRIEIKRFARRVIERFRQPVHDVAVLLPCSARKPYSLSQSHRRFIDVIGQRAHELIVTSPLGLVPRELERVYPAAHYDVPVTGYWDREELAFTAETLATYLVSHPYRRVIAHLEGGARTAAEKAAEICGIELEHTCRDHPLDDTALQALDSALSGEHHRRSSWITGLLSWQFNTLIESRDMTIRGRYPEQMVSRGRTQLFSIDPGTGLCRPTYEGWKVIGDRYRVTIDSFVPQGDILAPGVTAADPDIREGDEVLVQNDLVLATGRAAMGAYEMMHSKRGVAVRVRKVKRL
jgi:archaeosine synthase alpha-subunit